MKNVNEIKTSAVCGGFHTLKQSRVCFMSLFNEQITAPNDEFEIHQRSPSLMTAQLAFDLIDPPFIRLDPKGNIVLRENRSYLFMSR